MEHYKNLDLADIVYFCEFDLVWKKEIWKEILEFKNYEVSNLGRIKSLWNRKKRVLKPALHNGYLNVSLYKNKNGKTRNIHQLVAEAFLNHKPCGFKLVVNHKNFIKTDNRVKNLEIVTSRVNSDKKHIQSSSKYTGVVFDKQSKKYKCSIYINGTLKHLGTFEYEKEASEYYENALKAHLNGDEIIIKKPKFASNHKGVSWYKTSKRWIAQIQINGKNKYLGTFLTELEAHLRYEEEANK